MEVVLTRARDDAEGSAARLAALGVSATIVPVTQILSLEWRAPGRIDAVIATSRHAFAGFTGRDVAERAALTALPLYAVGPATAAAAREVGFGDLRVAAGDAQALVDLLVLTNARGRALYLAGVDRKPAIEAALARMGLETALALAYEARALEWDAEARGKIAAAARNGAAVLHYSRRGADLFVKQIDKAGLDQSLGRFLHFAISHDAAAPIQNRGLRVVVANRPGEDGLFALLAP